MSPMATEYASPETFGEFEDMVDDYLVSTPEGMPPADYLRDDQWLRRAFVLPSSTNILGDDTPSIDPKDMANYNFSSASLKFTNTSLGGNFHINPPASYTPYADVPHTGIRSNSQEMG